MKFQALFHVVAAYCIAGAFYFIDKNPYNNIHYITIPLIVITALLALYLTYLLIKDWKSL